MRCVCNVATGAYTRGQDRLAASEFLFGTEMKFFRDVAPPGSPSHYDKPYSFKSFCLKAAADMGATTLLWADACILPIRPLDSLWEKIEQDGAWISRNGWANAEWTPDSAYADLGVTREENWQIPHVVATAFGLSLEHPTGKAIFDEYLRLSQTDAFKGPWFNRNHPDYRHYPTMNRGRRWCEPCGPENVRGSRHDQVSLSVLAWRNGVTLTDPPNVFAYSGGESENTILVADASYLNNQ